MRKLLTLAVVILCSTATSSFAGRLSPGLERMMRDMKGSDELTVLVSLQDQAPIASLDQSLHASRARMADRHRTIVDALRETAARSQGPLLQELSTRKAAGTVRGYTAYWITNAIIVATNVDGVRQLATRSDVDVIEAELVPKLIEPFPSAEKSSGDVVTAIGITPGVVNIGARRVWEELGINGTGALIGGLDTGVDGTHPALASRWRGNFAPASECWHDAVGFGDPTPVDHHYHGTHTMGTMTGLAPLDTIGVAPGALWIADNSINQGVGGAFDSDIINAFQWFADPDGNSNTLADVPDVVQNSWGINEGFGGNYVDCDSRWWAAIDNCEAAGVCVTWSAGNEGPGPTSLRSPADRATTPYNTFSVGATLHSPPFTIAGFSSRGPSGCGGPYAMKPEISAPGVSIYSAQPGGGYQYLDGTSMAGPHVAGVVALMRSANPDVDVQTIKQILMDTAVDLGPGGEDNTYGHGFLNAYDAVIAVLTGYGRIDGTVTDGTFGTPIAGANVDVLADPRAATTNASGFFSITLPAGTWTLEYSAPGYVTGQLVVQVTAQQVANGSFAMTRLPDPTVGITPTSLSVTLPPGQQTPRQIDITNTGGGTLNYTVSLQNAPAAHHGPTNGDGTLEDLPAIIPTTPNGSGGPDAFGHYWIDSDDPYGPTYSWVELAGVGTQYLIGDNNYTASLPLGFSFPYYGNNYTSLHVSVNGFVSFTSPSGAYNVNGTIPNAADPDDMIAAFWDDLNGLDGGQLYTYQDAPNSRFIVEWKNIPRFGTGGVQKETFEIILNSDGTILAQYQSVSNATSATVGIENATGSDGLQVNYNAAYLHNNMAIRFSNQAPVPWLSVAPLSGTIPPQSAGFVTATFNAVVPLGTYHALIRFGTNDPFNPIVDLPVTLNVSDATDALVDVAAPTRFELGAPRPNPAGAATSVQYTVPAGAGNVSIAIYDVAGRHVRQLVQGVMPLGRYMANWDARDDEGRRVASGVYFYRMDATAFSQVRKVTILK